MKESRNYRTQKSTRLACDAGKFIQQFLITDTVFVFSSISVH